MHYDFHTAYQMTKTHECRYCGLQSVLEVRNKQGWDLWCPACGNSDRFAEKVSLRERWERDPNSVPVHMARALEDIERSEEEMATETLTVLTPLTEKVIVERLDGVQWSKEMTPIHRAVLAQLAVHYGLDPFLGHIIWYRGAPYITVHGMLHKAHEDSHWTDQEIRPLTPEERTQYGVVAPVAWGCWLWRSDKQHPAFGIGEADPERPHDSSWNEQTKRWEKGNPIERREPWRMARSRALRMALALYFPVKIPLRVAEDAGVYVSEDAKVTVAEVIDGVATPVAEPDLPWAEPPRPPEPEPPPPPPDPLYTARARVLSLVAELKGQIDDRFLTYFRLQVGADYNQATADQLDHFAHHLADLIATKEEREAARRAKETQASESQGAGDGLDQVLPRP